MFRDPGIAAQVDEGCGVGHAAYISKPTLNIGRMSGGLKMNVLPSECRVEVDIRLPVGLTREEMRPSSPRSCRASRRPPGKSCPRPTTTPNWSDPDGEMMQILQDTVVDLGRRRPVPVITLGATDTRLWRYNGVPAYIYGASPETMAAADENVLIEEFLHILKTHVLAAARYLGSA